MPTKFILDPSPLIVLSLLPLFYSFLSLKMVVGNFIYLNVRGISNFRKRRRVFTWCRKQKADVNFLKETHSMKDNELLRKREWGAPFFCSHGANNSRGVSILIRNNFYCSVEEIVTDADGRYIMLKVLLRGERAISVNIYGPNRENKLIDFYHRNSYSSAISASTEKIRKLRLQT